MGKRNRNKQRQQQKKASPNTNSQNDVQNNAQSDTVSESSVNKEVIVTKEDMVSSVTQAEFDEKKDTLILQALEDIEKLEKEKEDIEKSIENAKLSLSEIENKKTELSLQEEEVRDRLKGIQEEYNKAEKTVEDAKKDADDIRNAADEYATEVRENAEKERFEKIKQASDEAKNAWKVQIDDLNNQINDIAEREAAIAKLQREVDREKRNIEDEKEELSELKEDLKSRKERYESANPTKIAYLETQLTDEKSKYKALQEQYQELSKRLESLQVLMDTIKTEVEDPENGIKVASMNEIVSVMQELRDKYDKLVSVYSRYPDDAAISALEEKARKTESMERENEALTVERNKYREQVAAANNQKRELDVIKREVEATNALNEHLLQELESHKTALESRTGDTCPALSKVDTECDEDDFVSNISERIERPGFSKLSEVVTHVKNFAGSGADGEVLYYSDNDIRAFLAGMAVSRLIILQGMSGTGKSSLPRIFSRAISGFNKLIPVESSWRDRNELLGYYNDFNKKFNAKSFTIELYRSSKERCSEIPTFIVLDEMNLARIEYYFSDFLAILQEPDHEKWLIELVSSDMRTLPMELPDSVKEKMKKENLSVYSIWEKIEKSRQGDLTAETSDEDKELLTSYLEKLGQLTGAKDLISGRKIKVTDNIWFIGTANRDESTFEISDKVYDRAQVISLNKKGISEGKYTKPGQKYISVSDLENLFENASLSGKDLDDVKERLDSLDNLLIDKFDVSFGNRIVTQTIKFTAVYKAAGGTINDALDYQISTKIIRKVITSDDEEALLELEEATKDYPETQRLIRKRLKELS